MPALKVLINGLSIAGPATAYWLLRAVEDADITIVERSPIFRTNGQSIDIRNSAVGIMQQMGIEAAVREKTTKEGGIDFVTRGGKRVASIAATGDTKAQSFTSEFEIFRGDLSEIILDVIKDRVRVVYGEYATMIKDRPDGALVDFANGKIESQVYDLVIGADGLGSKTRALTFNTTTREHIRSLNFLMAFYTIPEDLLKGRNFATWHICGKGRMMLLRPDPLAVTRANFGVYKPKTEAGRAELDHLIELEKAGGKAFKDELARIMKDAGHNSDRVIQGMYEADDFYSTEIGQIYADTISSDHVTLVGDAGYCPSVLTGMGTSTALMGTYILAGEISKNPHDIPAALKSYQDIIIPIARKIQKLPPGFPTIINPQSFWGVKIVLFFIWLFLALRLDKLAGKIQVSLGDDTIPMPEYKWRDFPGTKSEKTAKADEAEA